MNENMGTKKTELSPELALAIRGYFRKIIAVPGIITALIMFTIGFFINDVAKEKAYKEAYLESLNEIHKLTGETIEMKADLKYSIIDSKKEGQRIFEETEKLRAQMDASTEWLKNIQEAEERMANYLATNSGFMEKVSNKYQTEMKYKVDGMFKTTHESIEMLKLPVGSIMPSMIPPHEFLETKFGNLWLPSDGREAPEDSMYRKLTGESKLPDLRGMFLRGLNEFEKDSIRSDGNQDPDGDGRNAGEPQSDQYESHDHGKTMMKWQDIPDTDPEKIGPVRDNGGQGQDPAHWNPRYVEGRPRGGRETRPKNIAVYWYIKIN